jgi:methylglyoxal synthase
MRTVFLLSFLTCFFQKKKCMNTRKMAATKKIALVAHDNKKAELMEWSVFNRAALAQHELYATGTTGNLLEATLMLPIKKLLSGPLGGDMQMGSKISEGELDVLIFFWDPMEAQPHDPDIKALLRVAVTWNIPVACDRATADFLLTSPLMHQDYETLLTDYSTYINRKLK